MQTSRDISATLLAWYDEFARALPWRSPPGTPPPCLDPSGPYRVWLSEVMLQQTTTAAVAPYFARFTQRWPTIAALAAADEAEVMSAWAGLGYYARARNLIACAKAVAALGAFPDTEEGLRRLPGVGDYTAAAIAAIAFGRRAVVIDANVERVVARLFAIDEPLPGARRAIRGAAERITLGARAGDFAQAMMDLGATICTPRNPRCLLCPLRGVCTALAQGDPARLPVKAVKAPKRQRAGRAYWLENNGAVWLVRRPDKGMLGGMRALPDDGWTVLRDGNGVPPMEGTWTMLGAVHHGFTHFNLELSVLAADGADEAVGGKLSDGEWWPLDHIGQAGLPTLFAKAVRLATASDLENAAAQTQPDYRNHQNDKAEIAPAIR